MIAKELIQSVQKMIENEGQMEEIDVEEELIESMKEELIEKIPTRFEANPQLNHVCSLTVVAFQRNLNHLRS